MERRWRQRRLVEAATRVWADGGVGGTRGKAGRGHQEQVPKEGGGRPVSGAKAKK